LAFVSKHPVNEEQKLAHPPNTGAKLSSNPYLVGIVIATCLLAGAFASLQWAPWIWDDKNQWWMQLMFCATCCLAILIAVYWRFRKRLRFWASLGILVLVHALAVLLFIDYVCEFKGRNYMLILPIDGFAAVAFLEWSMRAALRKSD
jgi:hypothetical protein